MLIVIPQSIKDSLFDMCAAVIVGQDQYFWMTYDDWIHYATNKMGRPENEANSMWNNMIRKGDTVSAEVRGEFKKLIKIVQ